MKKFIAILFTLLACAFVLFGCGGNVTGGASEVKQLVSEDDIEENLEYFLGVSEKKPDGDIGNRKSTSLSEENAAKRLFAKYNDVDDYPNIKATPLSKTGFDLTVSGKELHSQNVELNMENPKSNGRRVIIGASYDAGYGPYDETSVEQKATGVFESATGVATLMSIIDYCNANFDTISKETSFDWVFVFFGCGNYNAYGASNYVGKYMTAAQRLDTLAMFDIDRMGGEIMYMYCDETETEHEKFMRGVADEYGLKYSTLPVNMPIIEGTYINDINYAHFGMFGDQAPFFEKGIPSVRIFSGYYGGFNLSDLEVSGEANMGGTAADTYTNLQLYRGGYKKQASDTATLIIGSIIKDGFAQTMTSARASAVDYTLWTKPLWAYLTVIFIIIALCVVLIILVKHFEKKHPFVPQVRRMKIAVFGMDYETKNDEDIFIDIKKPGNPFDGY